MRFILTADWHLRNNAPVNRKDDFLKIQEETIDFIYSIAEKENAPVIVAGDLFHSAKPYNAQSLEIMLINYFKKIPTIFIAGNHDLLYHSMENINQGSIGVLYNSFNIPYYNDWINFYRFNFGENNLSSIELDREKINIAVMHRYCASGKIPEYIDDGIMAEKLLDENDFDLILIGDNHQSFEVKREDKILVNPGCITRQNLNEKDYHPRIYLFDSVSLGTIVIPLPDLKDDVFVSYDDSFKHSEDRIDSFISKIKNNQIELLSYKLELLKYCNDNKIDDNIKSRLLKYLEQRELYN